MKWWFSMVISTKNLYISVANQKNFVAFAFTYVLRSPVLFITISAWIYTVLTAMKRGNEALNDSPLKFLRSVKCFIIIIFYSALNASSPLLLKKNRHLMLERHYNFKEILRLQLHNR
jgi:hypothetical protein